MNRKFLIAISLLVAILFAFEPSWAYDKDVHSTINEKVAKEASQIDSVLKTQLGISDGIQSIIANNGEKKEIWRWIAYGGKAEDFGKNGENDVWSTRAYNHFHDPLEEWADARFNNLVNINYLLRYGRHPVSSILWGLYPGMQDFSQNTTGDWSWNKARIYFYNALSGLTKEEIDQNYADCFRALGQVTHLLQDASVPAHTRNDLHIYPKMDPITGEPIGRWTYETYTKENKDHLDYTPDQSGDLPHSDLLADPNPDPNYNNMIPVSGLFDRNMYNQGSPIPAGNAAIGLAEYSNANFFSQDTIWTYQHPSLDDTNYATIDWLNPTSVVAEDGKTDNRIHIKKTAGEPINRLAAADYWSYEYLSDINMIESPFFLDEKCWEDYAEKLVPRAVGYSAALLDYFFRGRLEATAIPNFIDNQIDGIWLKIKNVTPTGEDMTMTDDDRLVLVCRYTPEGANSDGSEDKFVLANAYSCIEGECDTQGNLDGIQNGDEATIYFYLPEEEENQIGMQIVKSAEKSVKCMLVFKGKLGEEETAVIGKYFTLGKDQVRFNEEWDNGPTGNYPWEHISCCSDNGSASNIVENSILIKDNTRYKYSTEWHFNQSYIELVNTENPEGIHITPDTYVEMKIDDMSIDASNPDIHWQALNLIFNDEILIQFTQEGQNNYNNYAYRFNLGENTVVNIYSLFDFFGIEMPGQLYLTRIDIVQQFYEPENPPGNDENQHMEVDSIRIIEGKHEE
jgi:hypothetical protein